jgi:micrococcal nuclease
MNRFLLACLVGLFACASQAESLRTAALPLAGFVAAGPEAHTRHRASGLVTGVADGDTFYMVIEGRSTSLRLAQIDAPEKKQAYGRKSRDSLRALIEGKLVTATWHEVDRYKRPIAQVHVDGLDVNAEQVRRGYAWVYRKYATDQRLFALEQEARRAGHGLWAESDPVEPWQWRKAGRNDTR